jgi:hypothetical protein
MSESNRIVLIEQSATLRHAVKKLIDCNEYEISEFSNYVEALASITNTGGRSLYTAIVLGWPARTNEAADELFATLTEPEYANLAVVVMTHASDSNKHAWVTKRSNTALVLWENHHELTDTLGSLIQPPPYAELTLDSDGLLAPELTSINVLFVDDSPTIRTK